MSSILLTIFWFVVSISTDKYRWSWDTVPLFTNFGTKEADLISDSEANFIATHYDLVSVAKCLGPSHINISAEEAFYTIASKIRQYASSNETKIIFSFAGDMPYCQCYSTSQSFCNNQSMYFRNDAGVILYSDITSGQPYYDYTQQYVREWWVNSSIYILKNGLQRGLQINGVFVDGFMKNFTNNKKMNVSFELNNKWQNGSLSTMDLLRSEFKKISPDLFVIGNGISTYSYSYPPNNYNLKAMPHVDGLMHGHFLSFEEIIKNDNGTINPDDILIAFNISQQVAKGIYGLNKSLLIKAWIGPQGSPMNNLGPTWPTDYDVTPATHQEIQQAALQKLPFPLSCFLCGMVYKYFYFGYSWFWNLDQGWVTCPNNQTTCDAPPNWYPDLMQQLGEPITDPIMTGKYKCNRTFQYANVYVDLNDNTSAIIQWKKYKTNND